MDTRLKKSHKLTTTIITLCILVPAFFLVSLYPKMGERMKEKEAEYRVQFQITENDWEVDEHIINYAVEASYYLYGKLLQNASDETVDFRVLDRYGWVDDYNYVKNNFAYTAGYTHNTGGGDQTDVATNGKMDDYENVAYLTLRFDKDGNLFDTIEFEPIGENRIIVNNVDDDQRGNHFIAMNSVQQYKDNVDGYQWEYEVDIDEAQLQPKNFEFKMALREDGDRYLVSHVQDHYSPDTEYLLLEVGAVWIMLAAIIFVLLAALILPFFKGLHTGWEPLFCMPFELVCLLGIGTVFGIIGMFYATGASCLFEHSAELEMIGLIVEDSAQYGMLLAVNFLGWSVCLLGIYIVTASLRQFLCGPVYYLKHRLLIVIFIRWMKKTYIKLYNYVTAIDISTKLNNSIVKIVLVNFLVLTVICCFWFFGIVGLIVYSVLLYIALRKYGKKLQSRYNSVLQAAKELAAGNFKISLGEELGVFEPIGNELSKVQEGFEKAVIEEAKSQSMKTELITNVSHDLKTPLTAIITYIDLLKKEDISEGERMSYVNTLEQKSQRLKVLIEDLFEVSKAQSGNVTMNYMDIDIVNLMKQVRMEMSDQIENSTLTFRWNLPEEKIILSLDGQRTYRVFENLLNNALKYAMPNSRVYVDVMNEDTTVKVVFRNTSAQELDYEPEHLTERFVRGDSSRNSEGSGLGLAIAKSFVELQNGKFNIEVDGDLFKVIIIWSK